MRFPWIIPAILLASAAVGRAHHGAEFTALEGFDMGHPGDGFLLGVFDLERYGDIDELSSEFSVFYSPIHRFGAGVDVRFAEGQDGNWVYSSVTPKLQFQLTDPHSDARFRFGFSIGYQFAEDLRRTETVTTYESVTRTIEEPAPQVTTVAAAPPTDGGGGGTSCNPLFDLDCTPTSPAAKHVSRHTSSHSSTTTATKTSGGKGKSKQVTEVIETTTTTTAGGHKGIHNHDASQWVGRLTMETDIGKTQIVANLIATLPDDDHAYWGYGVGARRELLGKASAGVEFVGDFNPDGEHEAIASLLYDVTKSTSVRVGTGWGLTDNSPDFTLRAGVLWRF